MMDGIKNGHISEYYWRQIIEKMYDFDDQSNINELVQNMIKYRKEFPINQPKKFDNAVMNIIAQKI